MELIKKLQNLQSIIDGCEQERNEITQSAFGRELSNLERRIDDRAIETIEKARKKMRDIILNPEKHLKVNYEHATAV